MQSPTAISPEWAAGDPGHTSPTLMLYLLSSQRKDMPIPNNLGCEDDENIITRSVFANARLLRDVHFEFEPPRRIGWVKLSNYDTAGTAQLRVESQPIQLAFAQVRPGGR